MARRSRASGYCLKAAAQRTRGNQNISSKIHAEVFNDNQKSTIPNLTRINFRPPTLKFIDNRLHRCNYAGKIPVDKSKNSILVCNWVVAIPPRNPRHHFLNFLQANRGTVIFPRLPRTLINSDATRYPWTRIFPGGAPCTRTHTRTQPTNVRPRSGKPHTASRMNIADIMLLYFITRVHRMRYADSFPACILHQPVQATTCTRAREPPATCTRCTSSFMQPGFGFRPCHSGISPYALPRDSADSRNTL